MQQDLKYHRERAMAELDRAISADSFAAAEVHFRLSSMHLKCAEHLSDEADVPPPTPSPKLFAF